MLVNVGKVYILFQSKNLNYLGNSADVYVHKRMKGNRKVISDRWYKKQKKKKEEQEVQKTLAQKSGGKRCTRKCQQFQEYE